MSPDAPTLDWPTLGPRLKARREQLGMSRAQVKDAGGPSPATTQRIENGEIKTDIDPATKAGLEHALRLPKGWISKQLGIHSPSPIDEPVHVVIEGSGERLLVAITEGASDLSIAEREMVLRVIRAMTKDSDG
jgi:transcriptional regulator with XRE-family HTH domain